MNDKANILYACTLGDAGDRLIAAILRLASIDYIKAKRKYNRGQLTEEEMENERIVYARCVENWSPFTYDKINGDYMLSECDKIAESNMNVSYMSTVVVEE